MSEKEFLNTIHKFDAQLHYCNFLSYVRRFASMTREEVDEFGLKFWELMVETFGKKAVKKYQETYP